jgi:hypothetical protein
VLDQIHSFIHSFNYPEHADALHMYHMLFAAVNSVLQVHGAACPAGGDLLQQLTGQG